MKRSDHVFEFKLRLILGIVFLFLGKFPFWRDMSNPSVIFYLLSYIFLSTSLLIGLHLINKD